MSCNYADGLSAYEHKGILGRKEKFDTAEDVEKKTNILTEWMKIANHIVVHTGAGISTSAGIPDFRGPNGVWTLEKKGLKPNINISFDDAIPTKTHMALQRLVKLGKVQYIISQNIDGLHLKSGVPRDHLAELHGNMFVDQCGTCGRQFVRNTATTSVGQKCLDIPCKGYNKAGRPCRGKLHDNILDWEHDLPQSDLDLSSLHSSVADLSICLGTTLQIVPSGNLPLLAKKNNGRLAIINLQPTKHDRKADLIINTYVDDVFKIIMKNLNLEIPEYCIENDPTKRVNKLIEWTIKNPIPKNKLDVLKRDFNVKSLGHTHVAWEKRATMTTLLIFFQSSLTVLT
ncbi:NAD-dependent protein deacetylase Sirt6 [Chrysoperla carnea]|uniref:NAD-dependent protein deacetylase Sirt6 n=1 Tax=Chrysoperla carnea TaxID=189513 RepID=UPI001D091EE9|nr:NAD-dependent protein deacetylase Sirt6 [Chrysoperla carnea]